MPIRVQLVDNHRLLREVLRRVLENDSDLVVVAEAATAAEAVDLARRHLPEVAVVDMGMSELNGLEVTAEILRHSPQTAVLVLSMHSDARYVNRALKAGARGYVLKDTVEEELIRAIRLVHAGKPYLSGGLDKIVEYGRVAGPA